MTVDGSTSRAGRNLAANRCIGSPAVRGE